MTAQGVAELAGDTLALAIALVGWLLHVRECRGNMAALREENARLIELLGHVAEHGRFTR